MRAGYRFLFRQALFRQALFRQALFQHALIVGRIDCNSIPMAPYLPGASWSTRGASWLVGQNEWGELTVNPVQPPF